MLSCVFFDLLVLFSTSMYEPRAPGVSLAEPAFRRSSMQRIIPSGSRAGIGNGLPPIVNGEQSRREGKGWHVYVV